MRRVLSACIFASMLPSQGWAQTTAPVDGLYTGTSTSQGSSSARCQDQFTFKLRVQNRVFNWTLPNKTQVPVTVAADGTFAAENGARFLNGKIEGTHLTGTTTGRGCGYAWSFTRQ